MSPRFLVTTPIPDPGLPLLEEAGSVTVLPEPPRLLPAPAAVRLRGLRRSPDPVARHGDAELLAEAQVVGTSNFAVGHTNIDVDDATDRAHQPRTNERIAPRPG